ncbi:MAG: ATP-binding cassette domain-containing protein [Pseudomonadota bacterium]
MITVNSVSKSFTTKAGSVSALKDISFAITPGEILGIVGKSGAGKTTLLRILSLQTIPDEGQLRFQGREVDRNAHPASLRELVQHSATVFQGFSLVYNRTVLENTALPLKLRGVKRSVREAKAMEMLQFVGLDNRAGAYPITLSGGEAQRVAIARSLVTDPAILFLDEPTSALDSRTTREILDLLKKTHQTYSVTMVLVAHHIDVVRYMCDRVLFLENGRIAQLGPIKKSTEFHISKIDDIWVDCNV